MSGILLFHFNQWGSMKNSYRLPFDICIDMQPYINIYYYTPYFCLINDAHGIIQYVEGALDSRAPHNVWNVFVILLAPEKMEYIIIDASI